MGMLSIVCIGKTNTIWILFTKPLAFSLVWLNGHCVVVPTVGIFAFQIPNVASLKRTRISGILNTRCYPCWYRQNIDFYRRAIYRSHKDPLLILSQLHSQLDLAGSSNICNLLLQSICHRTIYPQWLRRDTQQLLLILVSHHPHMTCQSKHLSSPSIYIPHLFATTHTIR